MTMMIKLSWKTEHPIPDEDTREYLNQMREYRALTDMALSSEKQFYPCHKIIVAKASSYIRGLLQMETGSNKLFVVSLGSTQSCHIENILKYMYFGTLTVQPIDFPAFSKLAKMLMIEFSAEECTDSAHLKVTSSVKIDDVRTGSGFETHKVRNQEDLKLQENACYEFASKNIPKRKLKKDSPIVKNKQVFPLPVIRKPAREQTLQYPKPLPIKRLFQPASSEVKNMNAQSCATDNKYNGQNSSETTKTALKVGVLGIFQAEPTLENSNDKKYDPIKKLKCKGIKKTRKEIKIKYKAILEDHVDAKEKNKNEMEKKMFPQNEREAVDVQNGIPKDIPQSRNPKGRGRQKKNEIQVKAVGTRKPSEIGLQLAKQIKSKALRNIRKSYSLGSRSSWNFALVSRGKKLISPCIINGTPKDVENRGTNEIVGEFNQKHKISRVVPLGRPKRNAFHKATKKMAKWIAGKGDSFTS